MISKQFLYKLTAVILSTGIALILCEIMLRAFNYHPKLIQAGMFVSNNSDILPYKLKPNYDGDYLGKEVKIDADGYRIVSPNHSLLTSAQENKSNKVILLLGDSLVFGHGLGDKDTIASQLQNMLWATGKPYTVKNIGVPGYSSWNEYAAFEDYLKKYPTSMVVLFYVPNDVTFNNDHFGISKDKFTDVADNRLHRFSQFLYSHFYSSFLVSDSLKAISARLGKTRQGTEVDSSAYLSEAAVNYSMEALSNIQNVCKGKGLKFSVGIYRDIWHYSDPQFSLRYEEVIESNMDKLGIRSFLIKSHIDNLSITEDRVYWNDPHPSAKAVTYIVGDVMKEIEPQL